MHNNCSASSMCSGRLKSALRRQSMGFGRGLSGAQACALIFLQQEPRDSGVQQLERVLRSRQAALVGVHARRHLPEPPADVRLGSAQRDAQHLQSTAFAATVSTCCCV